MSCKKASESNNSTPGKFLVKSKYVINNNPSDTTLISFERDTNKRWVHLIKKSSARSWYLWDITASRQQDGKIVSLRKITELSPGIKDTFIHKLYYQNNSNSLAYSLTEVKYGNGLIRVDSIRFHYSMGKLDSSAYFFKDHTGIHFLQTDRFEYDTQGNITQKIIESNPFFFTHWSYEFEYDYTKKAPITLENDLAIFIEFPQLFFSDNLLKKTIYKDGFNSPGIYQLNSGSSLFNSSYQPNQLSFESSGGGLNFTDQYFFIYLLE